MLCCDPRTLLSAMLLRCCYNVLSRLTNSLIFISMEIYLVLECDFNGVSYFSTNHWPKKTQMFVFYFSCCETVVGVFIVQSFPVLPTNGVVRLRKEFVAFTKSITCYCTGVQSFVRRVGGGKGGTLHRYTHLSSLVRLPPLNLSIPDGA